MAEKRPGEPLADESDAKKHRGDTPADDGEQARAIQLFKDGFNILITGPAGTGKSFVLRAMISSIQCEGRYVTAPTGSAALLISGTTLHSFLGAGLATDPVDEILKRLGKEARQRIWRARVLIIDEVSMVSAEFFDKVEEVVRRVKAVDKPMGGVQLIMCGDFLQLPPVEGRFCFLSEAFRRCISDPQKQIVYLTRVFRQTNMDMVMMLNDIRRGVVRDTTMDIINSCVARPLKNPVILRPKRAQVEAINSRKLQELPGPVHTYTCRDSGEHPYVNQLKDCIAPPELHLKKGAFVMLVMNRSSILVNGSTGHVTSFGDDGYPIVTFTNGAVVACPPVVFTIEVEGRVRAMRTQVPLILAWACTIHKTQGTSLDEVDVDFTDGCFAFGQAYVALSRAKTLDGLSIKGFDPASVLTSEEAIKWYETLEARASQSA